LDIATVREILQELVLEYVRPERTAGMGCIDKKFRKNISPKLKFKVWKL
jgi:hypothetical protein